MNTKAKNFLKYTFFLLLGAFFLYLAFRKTNFEKLIYDFTQANYVYVLISMGCGYLAFISRGVRWNFLLEPLGKKAHTWNAIHAIALGYLANAAVPRAGEVARCTSLKATDDIPVNRLFGTVMLERVIDSLVLLGLMLTTFILEFDHFMNFFDTAFERGEGPDTAGLAWKIAVVLLVVAAVVLLYVFRERFKGHPAYAKVRQFWYGFKEGFKSLGKVKNKPLFVFHTLFIWGMYYLMMYVVVFALPATTHLDPGSGLFLMIVGGLGMVVPSPGGIGSYHYLVMLGMVVLGVSAEDGVSFATLVHGGQFVMTLIGGLVAIGVLYFKRKKLKLQL